MTKLKRWWGWVRHFGLMLSGGVLLVLANITIDLSMTCSAAANRRFLRAGELAEHEGLFE